MARIRSIHPSLFTDEAYMALGFEARELLKGLWCEADDHGVFEWKPLTLKARILPADNLEIGALLDELARGRFIVAYEAGGRRLGAVRNFCRFQRPKKPKYVFALTDAVRPWVGLAPPGGEPVPHRLPPEAEPAPQREEGNGEGGGEGEGDSDSVPDSESNSRRSRGRASKPELDAAFAAFWRAYPHRGLHSDPQKPARAAFARALRDGVDPALVAAAAARYAAAMRGTDPQHVAQAVTWLTQARWEQYGAAPAPAPARVTPAEAERARWQARLAHFVATGNWFVSAGHGPPPHDARCQARAVLGDDAVDEALARRAGAIAGGAAP